METKKLLTSQRELLLIKKEAHDRQLKRLLRIINIVASELGIPREEFDQWELNDKAEYFEKKKD